MWFEAGTEKKKERKPHTDPTVVKGINKRKEKENWHKHRGFYSEGYNADESPECTRRRNLRAGARRVVRRGRAERLHSQASAEQLLDF